MVLSFALPIVSMTFDGGPSPATNIPVVHTLLYIDLEPEEPQKRYEKNGRVTAIILVHKSSKLAQQFKC